MKSNGVVFFRTVVVCERRGRIAVTGQISEKNPYRLQHALSTIINVLTDTLNIHDFFELPTSIVLMNCSSVEI